MTTTNQPCTPPLGIALLMRFVRESPAPGDWPPHFVNHTGWLKSNASKWSDGVPAVGKAGPFLTEEPERFAPTWLSTVDQVSVRAHDQG